MNLQLKGKTVTAATAGIGLAIAGTLAQESDQALACPQGN